MERQVKGDPGQARERVLIAVDGRRNAPQAVRAGKRIADRLGVAWTAAFVDTGRPRTEALQEALDGTFRLVESLGGQTAVLRGPHVDEEILAYARDQNASAVVIARTRRRPMSGWFRQTLTQRLLRRHTGFELIIAGSKPEPPRTQRRGMPWLGMLRQTPLGHYLSAAWVVSAAIIVSALLEKSLPLPATTSSLIFLTGVLVVAARTSLPAALAAAVMSSVAFNFFFLEPQFSLAYGAAEVIATLLFLVVAVIGGNLANRLRAQVVALRATNEQSQALLAASKRLATAPDAEAVQRISVELIAAFERTPACFLAAGAEGAGLHVVAAAPYPIALSDKERAAAAWAFEHGRPGGYQNKAQADMQWRFIPLLIGQTCYGVLGVKLGDLPFRAASEQLLLLDTLANQVTLTLARTELTSSLAQARVVEERERLRSALLSSVSHDLRTPLSSIIGSASTLRDFGRQLTEADKRELLNTVMGEGERLDRYIQNLLDMTRLDHGGLELDRDWVTFADVVAAALHRLRAELAHLQVARDIPAGLPLLYVHPALIEQGLVNIIENAARFSPAGGALRIAGRLDEAQLVITVTDQGPGIPAADRKRAFDMFFSGDSGDTGRHGSGLGLAICHAVVKAHGGSIEALAGPDGRGTSICIRLPLYEQAQAPQSAES